MSSPERVVDRHPEFEAVVYTAVETAALLKISRSTMYRLIREGEIKCVKIGRKILIPSEFIKLFLEKSSDLCYNNQQVKNRPVAGKERIYDSNREP